MFQSRLLLALLAVAAPAFAQPSRPAITGIAHMAVYAADPAATERFYTQGLGAMNARDPENPQGTLYRFSAAQAVEVLPLPAEHSIRRLDHVAFTTTDVVAMRRYLAARGLSDMTAIEHGSDGSQWFYAHDPEHNRVEFLQSPPACAGAAHTAYVTSGTPALQAASPPLISNHVIHVGFLVRDRAAEDRFYRDLLGFRPYWYGAAHSGKVDWVSQQVPEGRDWLEYMMANADSDTADASAVDARQLGVMDHFSLGVPNMEAAVTKLIGGGGWALSQRHDGPQMGHDGKWQANLYDPDGTRVELMEFQRSVKACCSEPTAADPTE